MAKKTKKAKTVVKKAMPVKAAGPVKKVVSARKPAPKIVPKPASKSAAKTNSGKSVSKAASVPPRSGKIMKSNIDKKSLENLKEALIKMRDRLTGQITALSDDSLKYIDDASSEDRTDDFDREFALNLVSSEHDAIFEINGALRRIEEGHYGLCDGCGCPMEKSRLQALPFARMCVKCQSEQEKGRTRFRPFGDTLAQGVEQTPEVVETEEAE